MTKNATRINGRGLEIAQGQTVMVRGAPGWIVADPDEHGRVMLSNWNGVKTSTFHVDEITQIIHEPGTPWRYTS